MADWQDEIKRLIEKLREKEERVGELEAEINEMRGSLCWIRTYACPACAKLIDEAYHG